MLLNIKNLEFAYGKDKTIFSTINFGVKEGEIISFVGPSGTGKSTLLKCIAGFLPVHTGSICLYDKVLPHYNDLLKPGFENIALVDQLFELDDFFTVRENLFNQLLHLDAQTREHFIGELLDVFELSEVAYLQSRYISGGEKQRLTMACALAKEPKCLLLDEPFVHFDVHLQKKIGRYLKSTVKRQKMCVILVTHNGAEALSWSDRIFVLRNGKIKTKYTPETAYFNPKTLYEGRFFGELNSVFVGEKQHLFRPNSYSLERKDEQQLQLDLQFKYADFRGSYYANYFNYKKGKEIVLYAQNELKTVNCVYVN